MNRPTHRRFNLITKLVALLLLTSLIAGCAQSIETQETTPNPAIENTLAPTSTPPPTATTSPSPTPIPTIAATESDETEKVDAGLFVLAMGDEKYRHLFAYHPVYLELTRLTAGEWDYDDPAVSPDGSKIAYCANESGKWEVYILDLSTAEQVQISQADSYACAPTWSPDGLWLSYETMRNGKLTILLQSTVDLTTPPLFLTNNNRNNFDPSWSPGGREIAFVSETNARLEIWRADLNAVEDRLSPLVASSEANYYSPNWSSDGSTLIYTRATDHPQIERTDGSTDNPQTFQLGPGSSPFRASNKNGVVAILRTPNSYEIVTYRNDPTRLLFPAIHMPDYVSAVTWQSGNFVSNLMSYLTKVNLTVPEALLQTEDFNPDATSGLVDQVNIANLNAPQPYLADSVNDRFTLMREQLNLELGWDFLGILQSAFNPLPSDTQADIKDDWSYTGRAIAVNLDPLDAGWMTVSREDYNGRTYWRVWLKCQAQDGTCVTPIKEPVWDFNARYTNPSGSYENGGDTGSIPEGYWVDFTAFALRYGWQRMPSESNWRSYFPATNFERFVLTDGLTWQQAMQQVYPTEQLEVFFDEN